MLLGGNLVRGWALQGSGEPEAQEGGGLGPLNSHITAQVYSTPFDSTHRFESTCTPFNADLPTLLAHTPQHTFSSHIYQTLTQWREPLIQYGCHVCTALVVRLRVWDWCSLRCRVWGNYDLTSRLVWLQRLPCPHRQGQEAM